ncbi:MAG TPA: NUDIX domain-containing protein [Anaerolineae bacterium]|nr:NUDIX domain-containing protein [Anaerolineae bacterium]
MLLVKREAPPFAGMWALPGTFVRLDESLADTAVRALTNKTGVRDVYTEQLYTFGQPDRDPRTRVITVAYFALIPYDSVVQQTEGETTEWFSLTQLPDLAFDHAEILAYALTRLRYKLEYTAVGFQLLPDVFTLSELQKAYEIILDEKLDKRNFRRKILTADILEETGEKKKEGEGRPAKLYRYRKDAIAEVKTRRLFP